MTDSLCRKRKLADSFIRIQTIYRSTSSFYALMHNICLNMFSQVQGKMINLITVAHYASCFFFFIW